jgi:polysaccharide export outer membrane protein
MSGLKRDRIASRAKFFYSFLGSMLFLHACTGGRFSANPTPVNISADSAEPLTVTASEYSFNVGDEIDVKLYYHPELNETALIRSDGKVSFQLVGDVVAAGMTSASLSQQLHTQYIAAGLRNPIVTVILRKSAGQKVFVGGEVGTPRMIAYEGRLSLSQALFEAGGLKATAQRKNILLLRDNNQGKPLVMTVSLDQIFEQQHDIALHPYDVVFVPKSPIARVNEFVDQYILKVLPITLNGGFTYLLGGTVSSD